MVAFSIDIPLYLYRNLEEKLYEQLIKVSLQKYIFTEFSLDIIILHAKQFLLSFVNKKYTKQ